MVEETKTEYPTRTKVKFSELVGQTFLVERIGRPYEGTYGPSFPVDITLADGTLAVTWVNGNSVGGRQIEKQEVSAETAYTVTEETSKTGRQYRAFREEA